MYLNEKDPANLVDYTHISNSRIFKLSLKNITSSNAITFEFTKAIITSIKMFFFKMFISCIFSVRTRTSLQERIKPARKRISYYKLYTEGTTVGTAYLHCRWLLGPQYVIRHHFLSFLSEHLGQRHFLEPLSYTHFGLPFCSRQLYKLMGSRQLCNNLKFNFGYEL